ncbi:MAG: NUDIX hydrolase [Actinomycetota bacterium]
MSSFRHLGDELVYRGHIWDVVNGTFADPTGGRFTRDIVRSPGAVAVVPILGGDPDRQVVLVKQYRAAFDDMIIEIPAGMRDVEGEDPDATAQRELQEESGYVAGSLELLHEFLPSPGMTDARLHVYLATDLRTVDRRTHGPEEDHMEVLVMDLAEAVEMVARGQIRDAKATIGLLLADRFFRSGTPG